MNYSLFRCIISFAIAFTLSVIVKAQSVNENIPEANVLLDENGILVFGIKQESSKKQLAVIKYSNDLKEIGRFSRELPDEAEEVICTRENDSYVFNCKKKGFTFKPAGVFVRLKSNLTLLSTKEYTKNDFLCYKKKHVLSPDMEGMLQPFAPTYYKDQVYNAGEDFVGAFVPSDSSLWTYFVNEWNIQLGCKKPSTSAILDVTEKYLFVYVNDEEASKEFFQYVFCLDRKTGTVVYKIKLNPDNSRVLIPSNALFDEKTEELYIAGNYADIEKKGEFTPFRQDDEWATYELKTYDFRLDGIFLLKVNGGQILKSTYEKHEAYNIKNDILPLQKYDVRSVFHKIIPLGNGEYMAIAENMCDANWLGHGPDEIGKTYRPFGFLLVYFNSELSVGNKKLIEKVDFYKKNGIKISPIFESFKLSPVNHYPDYYYSNISLFSNSRNHYSFSNCSYDEKNRSLTLLYNNFAGTTTYYTVKVNADGTVLNKEIPNQQINAKKNSLVFFNFSFEGDYVYS